MDQPFDWRPAQRFTLQPFEMGKIESVKREDYGPFFAAQRWNFALVVGLMHPQNYLNLKHLEVEWRSRNRARFNGSSGIFRDQ